MKTTLSNVLPALAVVAVASLAFSGCQQHDSLNRPSGSVVVGSGDPNDSVDSRFDPTAAQNAQFEKLLVHLADAVESRDFDKFAQLFDPKQYHFVFDPADVAQNPELPDTWSWSEESSAAQRMFESDLVQSVSVDYQVGAPRPVEEFDNAPLHWHTARVTNIDLEVVTTDPEGGDDIVFKVAGDHAQFFFEVPSGRSFERRVTRITEWRDIRIGKRPGGADSGAQPRVITSWGQIKAVFG